MTAHKQRTEVIFTNISPYIKSALYRLTAIQGVNINEYTRSLILQDLGQKGFFSAVLKSELGEANSK